MSYFRTLCRLAALTISALPLAFGVNAAEPVTPLLRLEELKNGFESFVSKNVTIPYVQGIKALNAKVKPALERESAMAATRKDLDALARIKADIERIDKGLLLTDADSPPPDILKHIYAAYKLEVAKIESAKMLSMAEAIQRYEKGLMQIQDELTASQYAKAALEVKQIREKLKSDGMQQQDSAPPPSGKSVLKVEKGRGVSFFNDELEDIQCDRANQGEPVIEWIFRIGLTGTVIKPAKGKKWLSSYERYRSVNEVDKNNVAELTSGEFWIGKGESFYAERGGLKVRVTLLEPMTRDLVILEIQPVRK